MAIHRRLLAAIGALVLVLSTDMSAQQTGVDVQSAEAVRARAQRDGRVRVLVELKLPVSHVPEAALQTAEIVAQRRAIADAAFRLLAKLPAGSNRAVRRFQTVPYLVMEVTPGALTALETLDNDLVRVMPDEVLRPTLAESVPLIEADTVWASGYDGMGTTIAVLDTGVDASHPFLAGKLVDEACYSSTVAGTSESVCPGGLDEQIGAGAAAPCPMDDCFHGTHVAGIAVGHDPSNSLQGPGVAKGAHLMAIQVFSRIIDPDSCGGVAPCTGAFSSDIIAGLEHVYASAIAGQNIAAANLSLGGGIFEEVCDDQPYKPIIDNLRAIGIATVVAAGNSGWPLGLAAPACISTAVSVGSTTKTDAVSGFSNSASFLSLFAPGDPISSSVPGGSYEAFSGTSMAAPHVAGAWGLIKQAVPAAGVSTVLNALRTTGLPITDTRLWFLPGATVPRVRLFEALRTLASIDSPVPIVTSLSPASARAGLGAITLTVNGSGFVSQSTVEWNGAARPTQFKSSSKLEASIAASDVSATGTALVRVTTPAPGGGASSSMTFSIEPPPVLTVDASVVGAGQQVTVTLVDGFGGSTDWLALASTSAANNSYLQWVYVGTGITDRTWTVTMPPTAGTYEFRLFLNNGYTRVATSPPVTVDTSLAPTPIATSISPATTVAGGPAFTLTVTGSKFTASSVVRWNGSNRTTTYVSSLNLQAAIPASDIAAAGSAQISVFTPAPGGGLSASLTLVIGQAPALAVSATSVAAGASVTVTLTNGLGQQTDWLALAAAGAPDVTYLQWTYVGAGVTNRTWTVTMPANGGVYEFRLFKNGYVRVATSPTVTVSATSPPALTVSATSVTAGSPVTVTLTNGLGGASDWLALAATGSGDASYLQWTYVGSGVTTRTWTVTMPATAGTYEFRLFRNGYIRAATSPPVTVTTGPPATLSVSATNVAPGAQVTATLTNGFGGQTDWIALAVVGSANTSYLQWTYVGTGVTTRTWTVNMPSTPGTYEFRLFRNNGYTRAATSPPVTVAP